MPDREKVIKALEYCVLSNDCRPCEYWMEFDDTGCQIMKDALALLKEQETKYPICEKCGKKIDHIITSVFNSYDGSDSEYSFPIAYDEDGGCIQFSTTKNWTGYELSDTEQKDSIRCPFCREFPFDANEEIELYEPEEVVVMMWEGR